MQAKREKAKEKARMAKGKAKVGEKTVARTAAKEKDGEAEKDQG